MSAPVHLRRWLWGAVALALLAELERTTTLVERVAAQTRVRLAGEVAEFNGLTEITGVTSLEICGATGVLTPLEITLPATSQALSAR